MEFEGLYGPFSDRDGGSDFFLFCYSPMNKETLSVPSFVPKKT